MSSIKEIKECIFSHWELRPPVSKWLLYELRTLIFDISVPMCFIYIFSFIFDLPSRSLVVSKSLLLSLHSGEREFL